jgi:hypothetical protein
MTRITLINDLLIKQINTESGSQMRDKNIERLTFNSKLAVTKLS